MKENILLKIEKLVNEKKIDEAQLELSKLGQSYNNDANYLYLRGKVFYINKLYYAAIDALLIALEFEKNDKIYNLLAEIYGVLGNKELKESITNEAKAWEGDEYDEHTVESYIKENASMNAKLLLEVLENIKSVDESYTSESYEATCNSIKETFSKKVDEVMETYGVDDNSETEEKEAEGAVIAEPAK